MIGKVTAYDSHVGLGTVEAETGEQYLFHCTQITDGTREIAVGEAVTFVVRTDRPKGPEAYEVTKAN